MDEKKYMVVNHKKPKLMAFEITNEKDAYALYCLLTSLMPNDDWYWGTSDLSLNKK